MIQESAQNVKMGGRVLNVPKNVHSIVYQHARETTDIVSNVKLVGMELSVHALDIVITEDVTKTGFVYHVQMVGQGKTVHCLVQKIVKTTFAYVVEIVSVVKLGGMEIRANVLVNVHIEAVT